MNPGKAFRTSFSVVAVLLFLGAAAATTSIHVTVGPEGAAASVESDALPPVGVNTTRPPPPPGPSFGMRIDPPMRETEFGKNVTFSVHLHAKRNVTLDLAAMNVSPGFRASFDADTVEVRAGQNASVLMHVSVPHERADVQINVTASARESNETTSAPARIVVRADRADITLVAYPIKHNITPGGNATFLLRINASETRGISLAVNDTTPGYHGSLSWNYFWLQRGQTANVNLTVTAQHNTTWDGSVVVNAWTKHGERASLTVWLSMQDGNRTAPVEPTPNGTRPPTNETPPQQNGTEPPRNGTAAGAPASRPVQPRDAPPAAVRAEKDEHVAVMTPWGVARTSGGARASVPMP